MKKITISLLSLCLLFLTLFANSQTFTNYTTVEGLPHNNVNCLVQDTAGNMWFGTQNGIAKFDGVVTWTVFNTTTNPVLADNTITAIAVDSDNNIWVGTDFGVSVYDGSNFTTYTTVHGLGDDRIHHIAQAPNGDIWLSDFDGATVYDGISFKDYNMTDGLPFGGINYIDFDSNGDVFMASALGGMVHFDGVGFTIYTTANGLLSNVTRAITIDAANNKWIGTSSGISVFDNSNTLVDAHTIMLILPAPDTLNPVEDVKINSQGDVWTGIYVDYLVTEGGIAVNTGGPTWSDYDVSDGLVGPVIRKIAIDNMDNVWVGTSTGVSKLSFPNAIDDINFASNGFKIYPNPTSGVLNITMENVNQIDQNVTLYNTSMQMVKQIDINTSQQLVSVSISDLDHGLYFVKYGNQVSKVVVN